MNLGGLALIYFKTIIFFIELNSFLREYVISNSSKYTTPQILRNYFLFIVILIKNNILDNDS